MCMEKCAWNEGGCAEEGECGEEGECAEEGGCAVVECAVNECAFAQVSNCTSVHVQKWVSVQK